MIALLMIALLMIAGCTPADGDRPPPAVESATQGTADANQMADTVNAAPDGGAVVAGGGQAQATAAAGTVDGGRASTPTCVPPDGPLAVDASLEGRAGEYRLTMVEEVDGTATRTAEGSLLLLDQVDTLREFAGGAGGLIPGVTSPLFGSTDVNVEGVGAVRVGSLSSEDPASPGVLVIESATGASPSILLRLGSDANRRTLCASTEATLSWRSSRSRQSPSVGPGRAGPAARNRRASSVRRSAGDRFDPLYSFNSLGKPFG